MGLSCVQAHTAANQINSSCVVTGHLHTWNGIHVWMVWGKKWRDPAISLFFWSLSSFKNDGGIRIRKMEKLCVCVCVNQRASQMTCTSSCVVLFWLSSSLCKSAHTTTHTHSRVDQVPVVKWNRCINLIWQLHVDPSLSALYCVYNLYNSQTPTVGLA